MPWEPGELPDNDPRAAIITKMIENIGWCLNSYGQIEYLIGDLVWQAWQLEPYRHLAAQMPMAFEKRIRHLDRLFEVDGPLSPYETDLKLLIDRLRALGQPRHMFAHGHCTFVTGPDGAPAMIFRRFLPPDDCGQVLRYRGRVTPESLEIARQQWARFASSAQRVIGSMYVDLGLSLPEDQTDPIAPSLG